MTISTTPSTTSTSPPSSFGADAFKVALDAIEGAADGPSPEQTAVEHAPGARSDLLFTCDHASNARPKDLGDLGLPAEDLARHIAYDVGARGVTLGLAALLGAPAVLATFSRLVIDPNRGEGDPTLLMRLYDRSIIPANRHADAAERERRLERFHRPYRRAVAETIRAQEAHSGAPLLLIAIHSFTPQLKSGAMRPWELGVLWDEDPETGQRLIAALRRDADLCVGDNQPYSGALPGDMMWTHGRGRPHTLLEIRNDLIETPHQQAAWAARLAPVFAELAVAAAS